MFAKTRGALIKKIQVVLSAIKIHKKILNADKNNVMTLTATVIEKRKI